MGFYRRRVARYARASWPPGEVTDWEREKALRMATEQRRLPPRDSGQALAEFTGRIGAVRAASRARPSALLPTALGRNARDERGATIAGRGP